MKSITENLRKVKLEIGDRVFVKTSKGWWPGEVVEYYPTPDKFEIALDKLRTSSGNTKHWPTEAGYCRRKSWLRAVVIEATTYNVKCDERGEER